MRVALISDIHGNLTALDCVLDDLWHEHYDQLVCLGDVAARGPQPHETVQRLRSLGCQVIMGNTDAWLVDFRSGKAPVESDHWMTAVDRWCADQLSASDVNYLATLKAMVEIAINNDTSICCFHGSPRSYSENILPTTPTEEIDYMLAGIEAAIAAGGHTHEQMLRRHRDKIIINPGSVGAPFDRALSSTQYKRNPWAEYALVNCEISHVSVDLRRVFLDVDVVARAAIDSDMPFAERWVEELTGD